MQIRQANQADWPAILAIYNQAVAEPFCTADTEPATLESRADWLAVHDGGRYPIYLAEREGLVVGWCSLSPWRVGRKALEKTAEVSYYIDHGQRGMGVGSHLLQHALASSPALGFSHLLAILLERNVASLRLLEKCGFSRWGHLPDVADFGSLLCGQYIYGRRV